MLFLKADVKRRGDHMKPKIYIDGKEGTTGLQIYQRLGKRDDIDLLLIDEDKRKDTNERKKLINAADIVFLCLPDDAARQAVSLIENSTTRVIDASTAHRTAEGWTYGFAELSSAQREAISKARFVANPGCHATGFISTVYPLVKLGILSPEAQLVCFSLTGYSGGGKKMIAQYEATDRDSSLDAPRIYGLNLNHKHLKEMQAVTGLKKVPVFSPIVDDYYCGMATTVAVTPEMCLGKLSSCFSAEKIKDALASYYAGQKFVTVSPDLGQGMLNANFGIATNNLEITVSGNDGQAIVTARFDNLGKGASGAAVQNMNIMLGLDEETGL